MFVMEGPPQWCVAQSMVCTKCELRVNANNGELLCSLPACVRQSYPVDMKHALNKNSHVGRSATDVMDLLMTTCGNGDFCSRLLFDAVNRSHIQKSEAHCSSCKAHGKEGEPVVCIASDGEHKTNHPPLGDSMRDTYDQAASSVNTPKKISDHDRHTREMQRFSCHRVFAQDSTHDVAKNCFEKKALGVVALWDCANENGEIASAVLMPSTKTMHLAHAAGALSCRTTFKPAGMRSDTWPNKAAGMFFSLT